MIKFLHHISYQIFKYWTRASIYMFYRRVEVKGLHNIDNEQPVFITSNHQNALSDPINMGSFLKKHPIFLTRADIFSGKIVLAIFTFLKMLPIYRERDKVNTLKKNEEIFQKCITSLGKNEQIIIFPEGNHNRKYRIRPLKKGVARIAFQAAETYHFQKDIQILPVGVNYDDHTQFYSNLFIHYGKPLHISDYLELYNTNPSKAIVSLTVDLRNRLKNLVLHITDQENYPEINQLREWFTKDLLQKENQAHTLEAEIQIGKKIIQNLEEDIKEERINMIPIKEKINEYQAFLQAYRLTDQIVFRGAESIFILGLKVLLGVTTLPIFLYGFIHHFIPYRLGHYLAETKFKDDHFHASIKMIFGLFFMPVYYFLLGIMFYLLTQDLGFTLLYVISLPFSGRFCIEWLGQMGVLLKKVRLSILFSKNAKKYQQLIDLRKSLLLTISTDTKKESLVQA